MGGGRTIADIIRTQATEHPHRAALVGDGRAATYQELDQRSNRVAAALVASGLGPGARLAYLARNATEFWEVFFGATKAGVAVVPLNMRLSAAEVDWILRDCEPAVLVVEEHLVDLVPADFAGDRLVFRQDGAPVRVAAGWFSYEEWAAAVGAEDPRRDAAGDDLLSIMYSSGTTGRPKGATTTVGAMMWAVTEWGRVYGLRGDSVSLVPSPYYHVVGGGWSLINFATGACIVQFHEVTPQRLLALLVEHRATHLSMVPTVMQWLLSSPGVSPGDFESVEMAAYGGSPISETVMLEAQRVFGADLIQGYGLTETSGATTILLPEDHVAGPGSKLRSVGRAGEGVEVRIVDPASEQECPVGQAGEVVTRGPGVTKAYWRRPDETKRAFWPGGWFRTGDIGYLDEDGYLFLKDRIKDMIVSGAENIYPAEVENAVMEHPAVREVAVIGVPSDTWGETPVAVVVPKVGQQVDGAELIAFTRERLAHYKCPTAVQVVEGLPRNASGKILKRELRAPHWQGRDRVIG